MLKVRETPEVKGCSTIEIINEVPGKRPRSAVFTGIGSAMLVSADFEVLTLRRDDALDFATVLEGIHVPEGLVVAEVGSAALEYMDLEQRHNATWRVERETSEEMLLQRGARLRDTLREEGLKDEEVSRKLREFLDSEAERARANEATKQDLRAQMEALFGSDYVRVAVNALKRSRGEQVAPTVEQILGDVVISFGPEPYLMSMDQIPAFATSVRKATEKKASIWDKV